MELLPLLLRARLSAAAVISVMIRVSVRVRVNKLLGADTGQGKLGGIHQRRVSIRIIVVLGARCQFDPNNLLTQTPSLALTLSLNQNQHN